MSQPVHWRERITADPKILVGKPVIKGTRISVEFVIELLAQGWSRQQILDQYDHLRAEDVQACLDYVRELLSTERVFPIGA
jgi:uncharacterized protein (DUF433 family)